MIYFEWAILLALLGAALGSFACASVWRLRAMEIRFFKTTNQKVSAIDNKIAKMLSPQSLTSDRSVCLNCGHLLAWYDLIPIVSWISLKGKCRYCHSKIGLTEISSEIGLALVFLFSYLLWPLGLDSAYSTAMFFIWLVACVLMCIIFIYDMKWYEIPSIISYGFIVLGLFFALIYLYNNSFRLDYIMSLIGSIAVLSGTYLIIFIISKGRWIGFGDIILGFGLALFLMRWEYALVCLFLANLIGTIVVIPGMLTKKLNKTSRVPFGPFLIAGFLVTFFYGKSIVDWLFPSYL